MLWLQTRLILSKGPTVRQGDSGIIYVCFQCIVYCCCHCNCNWWLVFTCVMCMCDWCMTRLGTRQVDKRQLDSTSMTTLTTTTTTTATVVYVLTVNLTTKFWCMEPWQQTLPNIGCFAKMSTSTAARQFLDKFVPVHDFLLWHPKFTQLLTKFSLK